MLCGWMRQSAANADVKTMAKQRLILADSASISSMSGVLRCDQEYPMSVTEGSQETGQQGQCSL